MNKKLLTYLLGFGIAVLAFLIAFLGVETRVAFHSMASGSGISVSGEGKIMATPDVAVISASIVTQAKDSKTAQDENSQKSSAVNAFLTQEGIADADIQTSDYSISPQYNYSGSTQSITGYEVNESYQIKVRDLTKVSDVLSGLVTAGANQVNNLGLQIDDPEKLQAQARQMAIDDAKSKAQAIAKEMGVALGTPISYTENSPVTIPQPLYAAGAGIGGAGDSGPSISSGQNTITVDVSISYGIR